MRLNSDLAFTVMIILGIFLVYQIMKHPKADCKQFTQMTTTMSADESSSRYTAVFQFPPHLLYNAKSLSPAYLRSQGRSNVSIVLGVPTLEDRIGSHLRATLYNLITSMSREEQSDTLIVVHIGESDETIVENVVQQIEETFAEQLRSGLIDIVAPATSYYDVDMQEDLSTQSKQNLDIAYLMAYAHAKGKFYVQLSDDILPKMNFFITIKRLALIQMALSNPFQPKWFVLDFAANEFAGKLFKGEELPYLITYLQIFYKDTFWPRMLESFIASTLCRDGTEKCQHRMGTFWKIYKDPLFQRFGKSIFRERARRMTAKRS